MIEGKTKSGIEFNIDENIKGDPRLVYLIGKMMRMSDDGVEASKALSNMLDLVLGDKAMEFMDQAAKIHKGLTIEKMMAELNEIFEALNAKN